MIRGRTLLAVVLGAAALVAAALWLNGARTYDGVEAGSLFVGGGDGHFVKGGRVYLERFEPGRRTHVGLTLRNDGDRAVKIIDVGRLGGRMLVETGAKMSLREFTGRTLRYLVAFDEFELKPHHERYVEVEYRMVGCLEWEPGTFVRIRDVPVRYRTVAFERTEDIRLRSAVEIRRGEQARCRR
jgi:hypothetical protein